MNRFDKHILVCTHNRPDRPDYCCAASGGQGVLQSLKQKLKALPDTGTKIRANASGCLDGCSKGVVMVIYPEGTWYEGVKESDVDEIISTSILKNGTIERLSFRQNP